MNPLAFALALDFEQPAWLWMLWLAPLTALASIRSLASLDPVRRVLSVTIRSLLVVLVVLCLAGVRHVRRGEDLTVIFLMDRSHSVEEQQDLQDDFIRRAAEQIPPDDQLGVIDFARQAFLEQRPMRGGYFIPPGRLSPMPNTDRTDVSAALRLAMAMFPDDTTKRIVLMSDGNDNMGDALAEARRAKADGIPIDVVPLWYQHRNEVYFDRMIAPSHADEGEQVTIRMVLHSYRAVSGSIMIFHNGKPVDIPAESSRVDLKPGSNTFFIKLPVNTPGTQRFEGQFRPDDTSMDAVAMNNTAASFTFVSTSARALIVTNDSEDDEPLAEALRSENVLVDMKTPAELGEFGLLEMMNYATIILANTPAATFTDSQKEELAIYVRDLGSGLIMLGGDEGFGAGGWIGSEIEKVMPVDFEIKHKRIIPRGALVLIMHTCEIARGNYWAKEMSKKSVDTISSQDYLGVLAYSFSPGGNNWEVPLQIAKNKEAVKSRIDRIDPGDMPDFGSTMEMAYRELTAGLGQDAAQKHVIILSDGDAQGPSPALVDNYVKAKITVSTIGIGWGNHVIESTLVDIARRTGGKYYAARNPRELPQIFTKESKVVRRPLIIDEAFRPQVTMGDSELLGDSVGADQAMPPLGGLVLTSPKSDPNVMVPIVRATDDGEDPVLAYWQHGLGKAVAFTSGYWRVWGKDWTAWPGFAKFWAQTVRWSMRQETPANFDTYTRVDGARGRIIIDALDKDAAYLNSLQLRAKLINPDREADSIQFTQTGPGKYEAEFDAEKSGQYLASIHAFDQGRALGAIRTGLAVPFSPEYRDLTTNEALLRQVAEVSGGRWLDDGPERAEVFNHDLPPNEAKRPAWEWVLAWLVLPVFLLDVAVRRLASWLALSIAVEIVLIVVMLFGMQLRYAPWWGILGAFLLAETVGWIIRFRYIGPMFELLTHSVTVLAHTGERSAASLQQLKGKRDQVRDTLVGGETVTPEDEEPSAPTVRRVRKPTDAATARRRFDVGDAGAKGAAGDLRDAIGGARAADTDADRERPSGPSDAGAPEESTTSRLLRTKRKKQE